MRPENPSDIRPVAGRSARGSSRRRAAWLRTPEVLLPLGLAALGLMAAPFYGNVMENVLWMGETLRALCGF